MIAMIEPTNVQVHEAARETVLRLEHGRCDDQENRIREALGLARGALPAAGLHWLAKYHAHLAGRLTFPFQALHTEETGVYQLESMPVLAIGLASWTSSPEQEHAGVACRVLKGEHVVALPLVDLEVGEDDANFQLIEDYWYWFWNWRFDPQI
jgi:hypothetical protein